MSSYAAFDVMYEDVNKAATLAPAGVSVKVRAEGGGSDLTTLTTDSSGHIAAGTLGVAAGTVVHFRVELYLGISGTLSQTTT